MKRFLLKLSVFVLLIISSCLLVFSLADGRTDAFYLKFTTDTQSALIVGSSRAAQGIQPQVLKSVMGVSMYNYAFSIEQTPYGTAYNNSIAKKLKPNASEGFFIIEVNPWSVSDHILQSGAIRYRDKDTYIAKTQHVDWHPNFEYMTESYSDKNIFILRNRQRVGDDQTFFVHDSGWLEVYLDANLEAQKARIDRKLQDYALKLPHYTPSERRLNALENTIQLLQSHGTVVLVRMPIMNQMLEIENQLMPKFDVVLQALANQTQTVYLNYSNTTAKYEFTDGHHLTVDSGKQFSEHLASELLLLQTRAYTPLKTP